MVRTVLFVEALPLRMRVKHFNADFSAWEDRGGWHSFEPVNAEPNMLKFEGLTLARNGNRLTITVTIRPRDGAPTDHKIHLTHQPL